MKRVYTEEQKKRNLEAQRKRRAKNPERVKEIGRLSEHRRRMRRYGVDDNWYKETLIKQVGLCGICNKNLIPGRQTHIDHNHSTGKVRGLLCNHCNYLIGNAKEDIFILTKAIQYLEEYAY